MSLRFIDIDAFGVAAVIERVTDVTESRFVTRSITHEPCNDAGLRNSFVRSLSQHFYPVANPFVDIETCVLNGI